MPKLAPAHKLNFDAEVVTELHAVTPNSLELAESQFRQTLDQLVEIFTVENLEGNVKIERMISIGCQYFGLPNGVMASVMGDSIEVICAVGHCESHMKTGDKIAIENTLLAHVLESDEPLAINNIATSHLAGKGPKNVPTCYFATQVLTVNGPLGTISFFSYDERTNPFSEYETRILNIIANWIGSIIGNEEQLEFLATQNDYYSSLFQTVPSMMMLCNADGLILSTSDRLCKTLGVDPVKLPGQNCHAFFSEQDSAALNDALTKGDAQRLPLTLCLCNGAQLDVELNSCIKSIGSMQGVRMIVLVDVSERNRAIKAVEEQNKQLALVNKSLNQFACMASHDLQEPLRKIQQFSHFLQEDLSDVMTEEGQHDLNVIINSAKRMSTLIQDLLKFSSAAKDELVVTDVELTELMREVCNELELRIEEANAKVIISDLPTVKGDRSLIRQLFTNLIGNSLKYRDKNRKPVITIDGIEAADTYAVYVTDNGIGFDQELAASVFEPFNRLHTNKDYSGNGIGLSICATVCEKHNWKLSASSQPGEGSRFTILMEN